MSPSSNHPTAAPARHDVVQEHVRRLNSATPEDHRVLLTELLVSVYPTTLVQDS